MKIERFKAPSAEKAFPIPSAMVRVCNILRSHGYQAHLVGGATRDLMRGRLPKDWDITTDATPDEVTKAFEPGFKVIPTGKEYGTVTVMMNGEGYEITTYRLDGDYSDGRKPDNVKFTRDLNEDLVRRDFTINTMALDPTTGEMVSVEGAREDLGNGIIRAVGVAKDRFVGKSGDALRMLRACRFASTQEFAIEQQTFEAMKDCAEYIKNCSTERIRDELCGLLTGPKPSVGLNYMRTTGLLKIIIPELDACVGIEQPPQYHLHDVWRHICAVVDAIPAEHWLERLEALFHDVGKPAKMEWSEEKQRFRFLEHEKVSAELTEKILTRLKFPDKTVKRAVAVVGCHMMCLHLSMGRLSKKSVRKMMNRVGQDNLESLYIVSRGDIIGSGVGVGEGIERLKNMQSYIEELKSETDGKVEFKITDLKVNGHDVMGMGVKQGPMVGRILEQAYDLVLENPEINDRGKLLKLIETLLYRNALMIYLEHAYPNSEDARLNKLEYIENPNYFIYGLPNESRLGSHVNGHMKLKIKTVPGSKGYQFFVFVNGSEGYEIKEAVEANWAKAGIPIQMSMP